MAANGQLHSETIDSLCVHDHACLIHTHDDNSLEAALAFIHIGLERGEQCLYVAGENSLEAVSEGLRTRGVDVDGAYRSHRLLLTQAEKVRYRAGRLDTQAALERLVETYRRSQAEGYPALRVTGEMLWEPGIASDPDVLLEYEGRLNEFFRAHNALGLCQYCRTHFPPDAVRTIIQSHPVVVTAGKVSRNFYYVPPEDLLAPDRASREVDRLLAHLHERQDVESRLRDRVRDVQRVVDASIDGFFRMAFDGTITEVNNAFAEMLGYSREELVGMNVAQFQPHRSPEEVRRGIEEVAKPGFWRIERRYLRRDGQHVEVAISGHRLPGPGAPEIVNFCRDVTGERAMGQALRESERRYRVMLDNTELLAVMLDTDGRVTFCNQHLLEVSGWSRDEILGRNWFEYFLPDEQRTAVAGFFHEAMEGRATLSARYENSILTRTGDRRTVAWNNTVLHGPDGAVVGTASIGVDITDRIQAVAALRDSEERFRELAELMPEIVYEMDERGLLTFVNRRSFEITGYTPQDFQRGFYAVDLLVEEDRAQAAENILAIMHGRPPATHEYTARTKDGRRFPVISRGSVIWRNGQPAGLRGFLVDITERKRFEEALRKSEARTRAIVQALPDLVFLNDRAGVYLECHAGDPSALLMRPEEFIGLRMRDVLPPELDSLVQSFDRAAATGKPQKIEYPLLKDGRQRHYEARIVPCTEDTFLTVVREITERREAEEALIRARDFHLTLLEEFPSLVWRADESGQLDYFNRTWVQFTGRPPEQDMGYGWADIVHPDDRERTLRVYRAASQARAPYEIEYRLLRHDGEYRWLAAMGRPFNDIQGRFAGFIGSCYDITDRKRAEEERRKLESKIKQTQKLESLGVLAGGIAHDFNNLLTGILGHADLTLMELAPESPAYDSLRHIETAARRAAELTKQLLAYSGKGRFVVSPVSLSALVEEMANLLDVSISKKCAVKYEFAEDLPAVEADATQLRQIVMNLIINASEAIGDQPGVITVRTGVRTCDRACLSTTYLDENLPEGRYVFIEVSDTGCGMDEATRARIFDPFFTTKFTGRGLGLAAVLGIVRGHRGAIQVYSENGRGTTFRVLLPASARVAAGPEAYRPKLPSWRGSGTVLVVDDEATVCNLARRMLEKLGFDVLTAADGQEAVEVFAGQSDRIRAVLLDVTMPRMDGREAFQELQKIRPGVPVVLSSGFNEQDATHHLEGQGLAGFVQKPYVLDELLKVFRRALDS